MFDNRWENWVGDFADAPAATALLAATRDHLAEVLHAFGAEARKLDPGFPDELTAATLAAVLSRAMPALTLPEKVRAEVPEAVACFLEYLGESGRLADAEALAAKARSLGAAYRDRLKPGGGAKGETIQRSPKVSPLGRNDPCPCGSGKKFKKCCMSRA